MKRHKGKKQSILSTPTLGYVDIFHNRKMWRDLANELNALFEVRLVSSNTLETHTLTIPYKDWSIVVLNSDIKPFRVEVIFQSSQRFKLMVSERDFLSRVAKWLGKKYVELDGEKFGNHYLVESSSAEITNKLISAKVQEAFLKYRVSSLSIITKKRPISSRLVCTIQKISSQEKETIRGLVETFRTLINDLDLNKVIEV